MDLKKGITETKNDPAKEQELRMKTQQTISGLLDKENAESQPRRTGPSRKNTDEEALRIGLLKPFSPTQPSVKSWSTAAI